MLQRKQVWRCDVCRICTFSSFQEACDHEARCNVTPADTKSTFESKEDLQAKQSTESITSSEDAIVIPAFTTEKTSSLPDRIFHSKERSIRSFDDTSDAAIVEPANTKRKLSYLRDTGDEIQVFKASSTNSLTDKKTKIRASVTSKDFPPPFSKSQTTSSNTFAATKPTITATKAIKKGNNRPNGKDNTKQVLLEWFASAPGEESSTPSDGRPKSSKQKQESFLTEQVVAYQFMEQRRIKQQNERAKLQRQQLRREQELSSNACTSTKSDSMDLVCDPKNSSLNPTVRLIGSSQCHKFSLALRFPNPSHVIPTDRSGAHDQKEVIRTDWTARGFPLWWKSQQSDPSELEKQANGNRSEPAIRPLLSASQSYFSSNANHSTGTPMDAMDLLQMTIRRYLITSTPMIQKEDQNQSVVNNGNDKLGGIRTLWTDRYYSTSSNNLDDAVNRNISFFGSSQKMAQDQLKGFIERFMIERQKIEEIAKEKQRQRLLSFFQSKSQAKRQKSGHLKKSHSQRSRSDDDLWDDYDSDVCHEAVESSLCLLSGPVGCGKSHLVHGVAKMLGCRKVVELHTGMKRNAASIKRYIEEATKSHSTFDMIHNWNSSSTTCTVTTDKDESNGAVSKRRRRRFIDSDSESDDDNHQLNAETEDRGSAVTVILIDEVDNLDPCTDHGFWTALTDLCKQSKCPIILTTNEIPKELKGSSFRWIHIPVERPTSIECANFLRDILPMEGVSVRQDSHSIPSDPLQLIAEFGNCDIRRILNELQMYKVVSSSVLPESTGGPDFLPMNDSTYYASPPYDFPKITFIQPRSIPMNEYCQLTITGINFFNLVDPRNANDKGSPCEVFIGNYLCPKARIIDDSTIIAIATPLQFPRGMEPTTTRYRNCITSYPLSFAPIRVCSLIRLGLVSTTDIPVESLALPDRTRIHVATSPYLVQYRNNFFNGSEENNSENEFEHNDFPQDIYPTTSKIVTRDASISMTNIDSNLVSQLLEEGVNSWCSTHVKVPNTLNLNPLMDSPCIDDIQVLDDMCTKAALASDSAIFGSIGVRITPFLSGSCRGFGFDFTEEFPKRNNGNSKPPSEERLILSGWKDNSNFYGTSETYMVRLISRERKLLHWNECSIRGLSPQYSDAIANEETDELPPFPSDMTEEDNLFPVIPPSFMLELPLCLNPSPRSLVNSIKDEFVWRTKITKLIEAISLLRDFLFAQPKLIRLLSRLSSNPLFDPSLMKNPLLWLDSVFLLDYFPLLRCMAVQERISEYILKIQGSCDSDVGSSMNHGRRTTRRSKKLGRERYFDKIMPSYLFEDSNRTTKDIVEQLASMSLLYQG